MPATSGTNTPIRGTKRRAMYPVEAVTWLGALMNESTETEETNSPNVSKKKRNMIAWKVAMEKRLYR